MPLAWDGARRAVYCADETGRRLLKFDMMHGQPTGEISYTNTPGRIALSPDGRELFVTLAVQPHSSMWFEDQWGYISVVDPDSFVEVRRFRVAIDPFDVTVVPGGLLVLTSGSGQWTHADGYDSVTGELLGTVSGVVRDYSRLAPHPDGRRVYLAGGEFLQRFDWDGVERTFGRPGDFHGKSWAAWSTWVHPDGQRILGDTGDVLACDEVATNEFATLGTLEGGAFGTLAFDSPHRAFFTVASGELCQYHLGTMQLAARRQLGVDGWGAFVFDGELWVAAKPSLAARTGLIRRYANPAMGGETNRPPQAGLVVLPKAPTTLNHVILDPHSSSDDQDPTIPLYCRWDFDGDGVFDTPFAQSAAFSTNFNLAGLRTVIVEVRDRFGEVSRATNSFVVTLEEDPGQPVTSHPAFRLPFAITRAVFDPIRERMYAPDADGQRLVMVDLNTGLAVRQYTFNRPPESLAMTPDGRWLYVALLSAPHNSYIDGEGSGFVAEFDLERGVKTLEFAVAVDPGSLVATDRRQVVVGGGSGQSTVVQCYDAVRGDLRGQGTVREMAPSLLLRSQERIVFSEGTYLLVYRLDPDTGALAVDQGVDLQHGRGGPLSLSESGTLCASAQGSVFGISADELPEGPVRYCQAAATVFDTDARGMLLAAVPFELRCYNLQTMMLAKAIPLTNSPSFLGRLGDRVFAVGVTETATTIQGVTTPALGSETNHPPALQLRIHPAAPTTRFPFVLDFRSTTDDADGIDQLRFRWDLDGNGAFDTEWGGITVVTQRFLTAGTHQVTVEVEDRWGAVTRVVKEIAITVEADPGEAGPLHAPWQIPFVAADTAFDAGRRQLWLSDSNSQLVARVNLASGLIERQWRFNFPPESLAITPNGRRLYAALVTHPHDSHWFDQLGYVAEFDLETGLQTRVWSVPLDPGDLAATDSGYLFVAGGSGGNTSVNCYRVATGQLMGSAPMYNGPTLRLAPSQKQVFAATYWDLYPHLTRFAFNPDTGAFGPGPESRPYSVSAGRVFVLPGETNLVDGSGMVYANRPGSPDDLQAVAELGTKPVVDVAALPGTGTYAVLAGLRLSYFRNGSLQTSNQFQLGRPAMALGAVEDAHFLVGVTADSTWISRRLPPAVDAASNQPPMVRWLSPAPGAVFTWPAGIELTAEPDDLDGDVRWVQFRENGTILGTATNYPFVLSTWTLGAGNHTLEAYALDNWGTTSAVARLECRITYRPAIQWVTPVGTTVLDAGSDVPLQVNASDSDGSVAAIRFYQDSLDPTNLLATVAAPPWMLVVSNLTRTTKFLAQAIDNDGVVSNAPPALVQLAGATGDDFYRAFVLAGTNAVATADNHEATAQLFERPISTGRLYRTLWWSWTPPVAGRYSVSTRGSGCDTILGVYTGTDIGSLNLVAANDDDPASLPGSTVKFAAHPANNYWLVVDGYEGAVGSVCLSLSLDSLIPVAPVNDLFANRAMLAGSNLTIAASSVGATAETFEPRHDGIAPGPSVWWEWVAPTNGLVQLSTAGSSFDTILAVYTNLLGSITSLKALVNNDDESTTSKTSRIRFACSAGVRYAIAVTGFAGAVGDISLGLELVPVSEAPANDAFATRTTLTGTELRVGGSNLGATVEAQEPWISSGWRQSTVWYAWRSPVAGTTYLRVQGAGFTACAAVFRGDVVTNLSLVTSTYDSAKPGIATFDANAGVEYVIMVDSQGLRTGAFTLDLHALGSSEPPRLGMHRSTETGDWVIELLPGAGGNAIILTSSDLIEWRPIRTNLLAPGSAILLEPDARPSGFYRIRFE